VNHFSTAVLKADARPARADRAAALNRNHQLSSFLLLRPQYAGLNCVA